MKSLNAEKRNFYIFLIIHFIVWSSIGLIRTVLPTDALEGIYWGQMADFGTTKHPPLFGWISVLVWNIFKNDYAIYAISQLFILFGFIYIYKIAKFFLDENKAMLSVIILEGCWVYSYITCYYGFNPDVIMLFMLPFLTYCFYNCMNKNKFTNWLTLGLSMGLGLLNKYQCAFLVLPMAIWAYMFKKDTFKNKYFYMSIFIAILVFSPHLIWLYNHDFFTILYFGNELNSHGILNHITAPLLFVLVQIGLLLGTFIIFLLFMKKYNVHLKFPENYKKENLYFILLFGLLPFIMHILMGLSMGGTMRPRWGFEFWYMTGIILFYFCKDEIKKDGFIFITKSAYIAMLIFFIIFGGLLAFEKNYRSRYPVAKISNDMEKIWYEKYNTPLKYLSGYIEWTLPISIYGKSHPRVILDTFGKDKYVWLDKEDIKKDGFMVINRTKEETDFYVKYYAPYLPESYVIQPQEYKFNIYNAFKQPREYIIYYFIVPRSSDFKI